MSVFEFTQTLKRSRGDFRITDYNFGEGTILFARDEPMVYSSMALFK